MKTIDAIFSSLYQVVFQPFQPKLIKAYASGDMKYYVRETQKAMSLCGYFSNVAFAGFLALGKVYFKLWLPNQDYTYLYWLAVISLLGSVTAGVSQPVYYVNTLTVKNKIPCWITIFGGLLNVAAMFILLTFTDLGPIAVVGTTAVIMLGINIFFNPIYSAKCIHVSPKHFYVVIIRHITSVFFMVIVFWSVSRLHMPDSWIGLIGEALVMSGLGLIIHGLVMFGPKKLQSMASMILRHKK